MAVYTRDQLVRAALLELGVVDANEAPEAEDAQLAGDRAQQVLEELYEDGLIPFDIDGTIPARYFIPLTVKVAVALVTPFSAFDKQSALDVSEIKADRRLNKLRQAGYLPTVTEATYF